MKKVRKLKDGTEVKELAIAVELKIRTKCPEKYKLIDMETGEEYVGTPPDETGLFWKRRN
jgi:hypothetical protein